MGALKRALSGALIFRKVLVKPSSSPRKALCKVLFLYGSAFSWVHLKERFRERSCKVLFQPS